MEEAKIHLSGTETELMCNAQILLTKNAILHKIKHMLEAVAFDMQLQVQSNSNWYMQDMFAATYKISKGENYLGLPYMVLDYPRQFDVTHICTVRSMFWWGHFFSSTLHITGDFKEQHIEAIEAAYDTLSKYDYYIGINEDQWVHHFDEENYISIGDLSKEEYINYCHQYDHIKIAAKWPLWEWPSAADFLLNSWQILLNAILITT